MRRTIGKLIALVCAATFALASGATLAGSSAPPVKLSIREPVKHNNNGGLLEGRDWNLEFRLTVKDAVGFVELIGNGVRKEILVISDAEGGDCLEFDAGHPTYNGDGAGLPLDQGCGDGVSDEVYFAFRSDPTDRAGVQDFDNCSSSVDDDDDRLVDDDPLTASVPDNERNKAYLSARNQLFANPAETPIARPVGAKTGGVDPDPTNQFSNGSFNDCYGYGFDEDLPGLVIMADVGAARVFDQDFDLLEGPNGYHRIRNMAGLISTVTRELVDRKGRSHVVAHLNVKRGMFEPLVVFDSRTGGNTTPYVGTTFLRRIDSGPTETFFWTDPPDQAFPDAAELEQLLATLDDVTPVKVRAALVEGPAPSFIEDRDNNGKYTSKDLEMMGYTLLSNQASKTLNIIQQDKFEDFSDPVFGDQTECPSREVIFGVDLSGNGVGFICDDGDGNSRSVKRVPQ